MQELPFLIMGFRWKSKNSDTFSVGVPQFETADLLGTSDRRLCILGNRYNLTTIFFIIL